MTLNLSEVVLVKFVSYFIMDFFKLISIDFVLQKDVRTVCKLFLTSLDYCLNENVE